MALLDNVLAYLRQPNDKSREIIMLFERLQRADRTKGLRNCCDVIVEYSSHPIKINQMNAANNITLSGKLDGFTASFNIQAYKISKKSLVFTMLGSGVYAGVVIGFDLLSGQTVARISASTPAGRPTIQGRRLVRMVRGWKGQPDAGRRRVGNALQGAASAQAPTDAAWVRS